MESILLMAQSASNSAASGTGTNSSVSFIIMMVVLFGVMYFMMIRPQKKRQKEQKAKSTKIVVKEIRFGPQTDDHDYNFKLKHAIGFLNEGAKVKAYVFFKGRSILFKEQGEVLLLRFANDLEDYGKVEMMPVLEGKRMIIMISPKKK